MGPREWLRGALSGRRISRARWDMRLDVARATEVSHGSPTRPPWLINVIKIIKNHWNPLIFNGFHWEINGNHEKPMKIRGFR